MSSYLSIKCLTYNVAGMPPLIKPEDVQKLERILLNSDRTEDGKVYDLLALNLQEVHSRLDKYFVDSFVSGEDEWTRLVTTILYGKGYIRIRTIRVLGTILSVYIQRGHLLHVREVQTQYMRLSVGGYVGLKSAVALRLRLYGVSLCFVNSHLSAHDHNYNLRVQEYNTVIRDLTFKHKETPNILYHDYIIWCGDLNFRINNLTPQEVENLSQKQEFSTLLENDQLNKARADSIAFHEFEEESPNFCPSYKFKLNSSQYDPKRKPAYTDRILFRCNTYNYENFPLKQSLHSYLMHEDLQISDHRPVSADFEISRFAKKFDLKSRMKTTTVDSVEELSGSHLSAFDPIIRFKTPQDWMVGNDVEIKYDVELGESSYLCPWDWIGLFKADFTSLTDFFAFTWASECRRTGVEKSVGLTDSLITQSGDFVLIYFGVQNCVLGISEVFQIRAPGYIELAREADESLN